MAEKLTHNPQSNKPANSFVHFICPALHSYSKFQLAVKICTKHWGVTV